MVQRDVVKYRDMRSRPMINCKSQAALPLGGIASNWSDLSVRRVYDEFRYIVN